MSLTFKQALAQSGTAIFFWVTVDGVNGAWFNIAPPTAWLTGQIVTDLGRRGYSTFEPPQRWQGLETRVEPFAGIAPAGRLSLVFRLPGSTATADEQAADPWLDYIANDVSRGAVAVLTADLDPGDTSMSVDDTTAFDASGTVWIGPEAIGYSGKTSTTFTGLTRGLYDSADKTHLGDLDQVVEVGVGGAYVADRPLSMSDRRVRVYVGTGYIDATNGALVPYGAGPGSASNRLIYSGFVRNVEPDGATGSIKVDLESMRSAIAGDGGTRLPRATAGLPPGNADRIYLSDDNNLISWGWSFDGNPTTEESFHYALTRLQRDDGGGTSEDVPDGWYAVANLARYIAWTMGNGNAEHPAAGGSRVIVAPISDDLSCSIGVVSDEEMGGQRYSVSFSATLASMDYAHQLSGGQADRHLWRELGFTTQQATFAEYGASFRAEWSFTPDRLRPVFRLPAGRRGRQIAYAKRGALDLQPLPSWVDDDGSAVSAYAKIGEEVVRFTSASGDITATVIEITGRGQFGTQPSEVYVEDTSPYEPIESEEIVQGIVIPGTSWGRIALQLAIGGGGTGGTFDKGWRGSGLGLPQAWFDTDSFLEHGSDKRTFARFDEFQLDDELANEAILSRCSIVERDGLITLVDTTPPLEINADTAVELSTDNLLTLGGPGIRLSLSETQIVNHIIGTELGYNPATGDSKEQVTWIEGTSAGTYGKQQPIKVSLRNVPGVESARATLLSLAEVCAAGWSRPFYAMDLAVALPDVAWVMQALEEVRITHPLILARAAPGRGVTALAGRVYGVRPTWRGDGVAAIVRVIAYSSTRRFSAWAPTAYCSSVDTKSLTVLDHYDSAEDDPKDATRFEPGMPVRLYHPGDASTSESAEVDSLTLSGTPDASLIRLTASPSIVAPFLVEFAAYNHADITDAQVRWVYLSDGDGVLGASDEVFSYV